MGDDSFMTDVESGGVLDRGELQTRAVRGAIWTGIHTLVSLPLAFLVNILLARVLGVEGYGRLAYLTTVIGIATEVASLGVGTAQVQFGSREHAAGRTQGVQRVLMGTQGFRLLVTLPVVTLVVIALVRVELWLLIVALVFGVLAPSFLGGAQAALTIENRTDRGAQLAMVGNVVTQVFVVAAALLIGTADSIWSARVVVAGALLTLPFISISRSYRAAVLRPRWPWTLPRAYWRFALPTGAAGVIGALAGNRIEVVLLEWFDDPVGMGVFGLAFGLAGHVYAPAQALIGPLVPAISGLVEVDGESVRAAFLRTTRVAGTVGGLLVVTALPALALLVPALYGEQFAAARDHVLVLGVAGAVMLIGSPHQAFLMARLGGRRILWISLVVLVANVGLGVTLIPILGVWGATACCGVAMVVRVVLVTTGEARSLGVTWTLLMRNVGAILLGIVVVLGLWATVRGLDQSPVLMALVVALLGGVIYVCVLRLSRLGLSQGDLEAISRALPARLRGPLRWSLGLAAGYR